jgi:hypothetical protein
MHSDPMPTRLSREVRFLKAYAALLTLALAILGLSAFMGYPEKTRLTELEVERINIIEPDGRLALVLANSERLPGGIYKGEELSPEIFASRRGSVGILWFNGAGSEAGGLLYRSREQDGSYSAAGSLTIDQYNQDQVVALRYLDRGDTRSGGLSVWDRSTEIDIKDIVDLLEAYRTTVGPARDSIRGRIAELNARGELDSHRIFVGSEDRTAEVRINDTLGRARIRMVVDSTNVARLEFLNETGEVTLRIPEGV